VVESMISPKFNKFSLAILFSAGFVLVGCEEEKQAAAPEKPRPAKVIVIGQAGKETIRSFPGKVEAFQQAELSFEVAGILQKLPALEGQVVKKGDLVAQLDQKDFEHKLREDKANLNQAKLAFDRASELIKEGHIARSTLDQRKTQFDVRRVRVDQAEKALRDSSLKAPFPGRIAKRYVENFQTINKGDKVVLLQDLSKLDIIVDVPQLDIARSRKGSATKIWANFEFLPGQNFDLKVKEAASEADKTTQTYRVRLTMTPPEGANILPGMTSTVSVILKNGAETRFSIPSSAVVSDEKGGFHVWIVGKEKNVLKKRSVKVGPLSQQNIVVLEGLKTNDRVVIAGVNFMREGMVVLPNIAPSDNQ